MEEGEAFGVPEVAELNPITGDHTYVIPPMATSEAESPAQIDTSLPADTTGSGFTLTITVSVEEHNVFITPVTVYVVVTEGHADGAEDVGSLRVPAGDHKYTDAPETDNWVVSPLQIVRSDPAFTAGIGFTLMTTDEVSRHPFASVTVNV